ncbi:polymerase [Alsobacter metallidurans]|uniref:Porin n=1 Tax=Alsobacter metallidurans TaxID=340221 RepID=A0A917MKE8_9HYPH|nr:porin [Alsobacter metallidurans]GGH23252.1 polymerase [Alsobacter metallidurans]
MKLSSVLLSSATLLATGVAAQAADLPSKKSAPVEYVRVCSTYGAGFFYIPGTDTCIRIGGRARFEYQYNQPFERSNDVTGTRSVGRIYLDARNATEYGLLRAYVRYELHRRNGTLASGTGSRIGQAFVGTGDYTVAQTGVYLDRAFVQFGGLTAGRTQSFFEFYAGDLEFNGVTAGSALGPTNLLAYTATFGGGFSGTIAIEDGVERRQAISDPNLIGGGTGYTGYGGNSAPDVVANIRLDQAWGSAQFSGALHQVRMAGLAASAGYAPSTEYGFALNAGVKINLPMLAAGDALYLQGTYSKGASTYTTSNGFGFAKATFGVGAFRGNGPDAVVVANGGSGSLELTTQWGLTAALLHYWTPTVRQAVYGSYVKTDFSNAASAAGAKYSTTAANVTGNYFRDWNYWAVGSNVTWSPIKDLDIGLEVQYIKASGSSSLSVLKSDPVGKLVSSDSQIVTRVRIQRDF